MNRFDFTTTEYKRLIEECPFTDEELIAFDMRRHGKSIVQIANALNVSEETAKRRIKSIAKKITKAV